MNIIFTKHPLAIVSENNSEELFLLIQKYFFSSQISLLNSYLRLCTISYC